MTAVLSDRLASGRAWGRTAGAAEWLDGEIAEVLVNDRGVDVGHFGPFGQPVDHKRVERVGVRNGDMEEEVVATGDDEDADGFGELVRPVAESPSNEVRS